MRTRMFGLAAALVAIVLTTGGAVALTASSTTTASTAIHVCRSAKNGALFLWNGCPKGYVAYTWNVTGPRGLTGPRGFTGAPGVAGAAGATGAAGPSFAPTFTMTLPGLHRETCKAVTAGGVITAITCTHHAMGG